MPPTVYMFIDERIEHRSSHSRWLIACVVVSQVQWDAVHIHAQAVGSVRKKRRLITIVDTLEKARGFAVLTYADISSDLTPPNEIDGTTDIPRMSRRDNLWSRCALSTVTAALACLRGASPSVTAAEIDLFYDPKTLTAEHQRAIEQVVRETLPEMAKEHPDTQESDPTVQLLFQRMEAIPKRSGSSKANNLQTGTNLAHHLCCQAEHLLQGNPSHRIVVRNHTSVIHDMISKFTVEEPTVVEGAKGSTT